MQVTVLAEVTLTTPAGVVRLPSGKPLWVFVRLALAGGRPVGADTLIASVWGDDAPVTALRTLQVHVSTLRAALRPVGLPIAYGPGGYRLDVDPDCVDAVRFRSLVIRGLDAADRGDATQASVLLATALDLMGDDVLADVRSAPFADDEIARLQLLRARARMRRLEVELSLGNGATWVDEARELAAADPLDERACGHLMVALYRAGRPAAALDEFRRIRKRLAVELGLEPGPALCALQYQILTHDPRMTASRDPESSSSSRDHRLAGNAPPRSDGGDDPALSVV